VVDEKKAKKELERKARRRRHRDVSVQRAAGATPWCLVVRPLEPARPRGERAGGSGRPVYRRKEREREKRSVL
jgi:hypothetical protein